MNGKEHVGPLDIAEFELFPHTPYERLTLSQREATYIRAKEIVFARTGRRIP